jgi:hypothetical protein
MSMELGLIPKDESFVNPYQEMEILKVGIYILQLFLIMSPKNFGFIGQTAGRISMKLHRSDQYHANCAYRWHNSLHCKKWLPEL